MDSNDCERLHTINLGIAPEQELLVTVVFITHRGIYSEWNTSSDIVYTLNKGHMHIHIDLV